MNDIESEMARCDSYANYEAVKNDLKNFKSKCPHCQLVAVGVQSHGGPKTYNIMLRGKLGINVNGGKREIGFKFIIRNLYPQEPPCVYLDEVINQQVIAQNDYLD